MRTARVFSPSQHLVWSFFCLFLLSDRDPSQPRRTQVRDHWPDRKREDEMQTFIVAGLAIKRRHDSISKNLPKNADPNPTVAFAFDGKLVVLEQDTDRFAIVDPSDGLYRVRNL